MTSFDQHRIADRHLQRAAVVYVRQSDEQQVREEENEENGDEEGKMGENGDGFNF